MYAPYLVKSRSHQRMKAESFLDQLIVLVSNLNQSFNVPLWIFRCVFMLKFSDNIESASLDIFLENVLLQ